MTTIKKYTELLKLTQLYLSQEYPSKERQKEMIFCADQDYQFFKHFATTLSSSRQIINSPPIVNAKSSNIAPYKQTPKTDTLSPPKATPSSVNSEIIQKPASESPPQKNQKTSFETTESTAITLPDFSDLSKLVKERLPDQIIINNIPNDAEAKAIKNQWKQQLDTEILILSASDALPIHHHLFVNLAKAISIHGKSASALSTNQIERENIASQILSSKKLEFIIATDKVLSSLPEKFKEYKTIALPDISIYLKDPKQKAFLWKKICDNLALCKKLIS